MREWEDFPQPCPEIDFSLDAGFLFFLNSMNSLNYSFPNLTCHFLCLETKKVTKENSRKTDPEQC